MCVESDFTVFALGRGMLAVESGARKLLAQIADLQLGEYKLVDHSERYLDQIDDLREDYTKLLANILELAKDKRGSIEHRETAKRIETVFDQCRRELWKKNCDRLMLDEGRDEEFKDVPVFSGGCSKWVEFRKIFAVRVLNSSHLNKFEKMAIFTKKVYKAIRDEIPSTEPLEVQWRMLCNKYDDMAAKYHVGELFNIQDAQGRNLAKRVDVVFNEYNRHVDALNSVGFKCDPLSEMLIGRLIQWQNPNIIELKYSKNQLTWSKVKAQLLNIIHDQCYLCKGKHVLRMCNEFKQLSFEERIVELRRLKVCLICFSWGHAHTSCGSNRGCLKCRGRHNTMIHPEDNDAEKLKELEKLIA